MSWLRLHRKTFACANATSLSMSGHGHENRISTVAIRDEMLCPPSPRSHLCLLLTLAIPAISLALPHSRAKPLTPCICANGSHSHVHVNDLPTLYQSCHRETYTTALADSAGYARSE